MEKIRKGDQVVVIAGKDKGKRGTVARRVDAERGVVGGVVDKDMPLHISNVALFNPKTQKADRVGFKLLEDGSKVRVFKSNGETVGA